MRNETVVVGEFSHETNTFVATPTGRAAFAERREYAGAELLDELPGTNTPVGGVVDVAESEGVDLVGSIAAAATPGGVVTADAYEFYVGEILSTIRSNAEDVDGVLLSLHGAMVPEDGTDGEGPLLAAVRELVGSDVPVVATLDLHANVTDEMCDAADALVAFESYPHVDMADTGRRAMRLLLEAMRESRDFSTRVERPPMLPHGPLQNTRSGPMAEVMAIARATEERDGMAKVNVFPGFHKADVPSMGCSVVAVGEEEASKVAARDVGVALWDRRESFVGEFPTPERAVAEAVECVNRDGTATGANDHPGPIVLADTGDNPGGGGTGDETALLRKLIDNGATNAGVALLHDPDAVADCVAAGVGERVTVSLGANADGGFTDPLEGVDGYVKAITDGEFRNTGPMATGTENRLGRTVLFQCGHEDGIRVVLTENRLQPFDAELWRHVGVQPERLDLVVVKSNNHYRADYEPIASEVVTVDSPGAAAFDPRRYDYRRIRRPMFPLDEMRADEYPDSV
ncbi:MAG: M81 family metallopeptidase [Halapricum sp.]